MDVNALPVSPEDLYARLGTAKAPLLIDVRRREAFDSGPLLIIGAAPPGRCLEMAEHSARGQADRRLLRSWS